MREQQDYITAVRRLCQQANNSAYSLTLAVSTPSEKLDDRLKISFGVGGLVVLLIDLALYAELETDLKPLMRKVLRDKTEYGTRVIEFYPINTIE